MVVYDLICKKQHRFEGWFPSFEGYRRQAENGDISCPTCGTTDVEKVPHACAVVTKRERAPEPPAPKKKAPSPTVTDAEAREMLLRLHHYVQENFENVGPRFAQEARAIFDGRGKERSIYGTSTAEEKQELDEAGVPYATLPKPTLDS